MQKAELIITALLLAIAIGTLGYFSTMQIQHGKQHTGYKSSVTMNQGHQQQQNGQHCQVVDEHINPKGNRCV